MTQVDMNEQLVLISGSSASGKSVSLQNMRNQEKGMYLNCEAGKRLPFKNNFKSFTITDPWEVIDGFDYAMNNPDKFDYIMLDTLTFLMDMYESKYVLTASNTMKAWSDFAQFFKTLMQDRVPKFKKPVLILAHTRSDLNEQKFEMETAVPIKGALKNNGIESYFSTVVSTKKVTLKELEKYKSDLLTITEDDEILGYKHVFQTRLTKETVGERIRSPMGMFTREQTYINNDAQILLDHLHEYYK